MVLKLFGAVGNAAKTLVVVEKFSGQTIQTKITFYWPQNKPQPLPYYFNDGFFITDGESKNEKP